MRFNYSKLKGRIIEVFGSQGEFAKALGTSSHTLSARMTGRNVWSQKDIAKAVELLRLEPYDIPTYFFTKEVQSNELSE